MTNLLQAGQLSQGSLSRRVGKADTLGSARKPVSWQQWQLGLQEPSQDTKQTPNQADLGSGPSCAVADRVTVGMSLHLFKPFSSSCNGAAARLLHRAVVGIK